jgi:tRNA G37 N-methylase Trm5
MCFGWESNKKHKAHLNNFKRCSSYIEENTSHLQYKDHFLNAVREVIAVYSNNHSKPIDTLCGQNAELLNVKEAGTCSYHCVKSYIPESQTIKCTLELVRIYVCALPEAPK